MTQENELYVLHRNGKIDWDSEQVCSNVPGDTLDDSYEWVLFAAAPVVALGGEKGEAVAWQWQTEDGQVGFIDPWQKESGWEQANPRAKLIRPLFAAPVGKARMLTDEEADHITGMHNTGRSQGDSECAEAIQRKFCEVNGITLEGGNRSGG